MPRWCLGWEVVCWLGHRRFSRHWSVPQLRLEVHDTHRLRLSDDAIETYIGRYQTMLAARQQDPEELAGAYRAIGSLVLTIDGLQPEKGHETLYVVRELMRKRVWFAEPLLSSATQEVRRLLILARQWAAHVDKPVRAWMSDKQDAFVTAIAEEWVGVPHRYCHNHFRRDVAQPVVDMDSQAKVKMRRKVRGRRALERRVLTHRRQAAAPDPTRPQESPTGDATPCIDPAEAAAPWAPGGLGWATPGTAPVEDEAGEVGLGYCAAGRGIRNDSQGGPLRPPGLWRREALQDGRDSLTRNLQAQKGGLQSRCCTGWLAALTVDSRSHVMP
jgi:hypothetical protein